MNSICHPFAAVNGVPNREEDNSGIEVDYKIPGCLRLEGSGSMKIHQL